MVPFFAQLISIFMENIYTIINIKMLKKVMNIVSSYDSPQVIGDTLGSFSI